MSAATHRTSSLPSLQPPGWLPPIHLHPPTTENGPSGGVVFTRQLWQRSRTMPEGSEESEQGVSNKSQNLDAVSANHLDQPRASRRTSSTTSSLRSHQRPPSSPSGGSKTPLTPEESPPFRATRKRTAGVVEEEDKDIELTDADATPVHTRASSGDSVVQVCICQPDPKIPRPRNGTSISIFHTA